MRRLAFFCLALVVSACGDSGTAPPPNATGADTNAGETTATTETVSAADATEPDTAASDTPADTAAPDTADTKADVAPPSPCNFASPEPGACGSPCAADKECFAGFCVPDRKQKLCTMTCGGGVCPAGWSCLQLAAAPDTVYGCVPASPNLGRPCQSDLDCIVAVGQTVVGLGDLCVPKGQDGAFCGADCSATPCPDGFACQPVTSLGGKAAKQCVAAKLDDNCTPRFEQEKAETACATQNEFGACKGKRHCEGGKLAACDAKTPKAETCNQDDDDCDGQLNEPTPGATCKIQGSEGACLGKPVCEGGSETCIGPKPVAEACNGGDDDCDGQTDEGCDDDKDGWCDLAMGYDPAGGKAVCPKGGGDCADFDAGAHPGQKETCNGADDNCNGKVDALDPALQLDEPVKCEQQQGPCQGSKKPADLCVGGKWQPCSAVDYQKHFAAYGTVEVCDDKDNDCSGKADDGCDDDQDGYCDAQKATVGFPIVCPKGGGDCNDDQFAIKPGAAETCDDVDQNCNGQHDEGCDLDKDGYCDAAQKVTGKPKVCPQGGGDCDDLDKSVSPGAKEQCDGQDDDCNGQTDDAFPGLGKPCEASDGGCTATGTLVCAPDGKKAVCSAVAPPQLPEACNGQDDDCDGKTDEGCDDDKDGWCDAAMAVYGKPKVCANGPGDCDDSEAGVKPGQKELCNGQDDDCDGKTDAQDGDLLIDDGKACEKQLGVCKGSKKPADLCQNGKWLACTQETYAGWHPFASAQEVCDNADNDCNGTPDEGCDDDDDEWCDANMLIVGAVKTCSKGVGDCDDNSAAVSPFHDEFCDNKDNDCNSKVDDGCDKDFDGYCAANKTVVGTPKICSAGGDDCNDDDPKVNPNAKDLCADFLDQNCDGKPDDGCPPTVLDYTGELGPDYSGEGWLQCGGYFDQPGGDDVPLAWGAQCLDAKWGRVRVACGPSKQKVRYVDAKKNVFKDGLANGQESGLLYDANFDLQGNNLIKADPPYNPNAARSWWVSSVGCGEGLVNLTVNNTSCPWEASNCFGQGLSGSRYLFVYVGK